MQKNRSEIEDEEEERKRDTKRGKRKFVLMPRGEVKIIWGIEMAHLQSGDTEIVLQIIEI